MNQRKTPLKTLGFDLTGEKDRILIDFTITKVENNGLLVEIRKGPDALQNFIKSNVKDKTMDGFLIYSGTVPLSIRGRNSWR